MRDVLLDVRCLQDPDYAARGIGRHALALLRHARAEPGLAGATLIGLTDAALPPLRGDARGLLDAVRGTAYTGAMSRPACHVQLSPMTHDPLFVGRLLHHPGIPSAAVVYDFIPYDDPERYLPNGGARLDYHIALRWLARHDLFLPISQDASARLQALLGIRPAEIVVTGAPLDPAFERTGPGAGRHVLVVGGGDPRKNPDCAIRAHARAAGLQRARVPLVVTGHYAEAWLDEQRGIAAALGGDPLLVQAPGRVDEAALVRLYADALVVAAPSRAEGFSLPVVEAMAAGAPVLASDIPPHAELVASGRRFGPEDDAHLARLLDQALEQAWRDTALAAQAGVWPAFRAEAVAARAWSAIAARLRPSAAPAVLRGRKPRVAVLTPLPPDRSGVADYSAAMCAELGKLVELDVFTGSAKAPCPAGAARLEPLSALPLLESGYDRVVSVLGNSHYHLPIIQNFLRYGGAAVLHDGRLLDVYHAHIGMRHTERMAEAELGRPLAKNEIWQWLAGDAPPAALILGEVAAVAEPLLVHSPSTVIEVARRHGRDATHLPFALRMAGMDTPAPGARRAARARLGIPDGRVVVASFGFVHPTKAPADCIWALDLLRAWGMDATLHFVGAVLKHADELKALCAELGLTRHVSFGEFVDDRTYNDMMLAADAGLQLRVAGLGAVSGALADCIGAGLPCVASAEMADAIGAPGYVSRVPDHPSPLLVAGALADLLAQPRDTEAERQAYVQEHGFHRYSQRLVQALGL